MVDDQACGPDDEGSGSELVHQSPSLPSWSSNPRSWGIVASERKTVSGGDTNHTQAREPKSRRRRRVGGRGLRSESNVTNADRLNSSAHDNRSPRAAQQGGDVLQPRSSSVAGLSSCPQSSGSVVTNTNRTQVRKPGRRRRQRLGGRGLRSESNVTNADRLNSSAHDSRSPRAAFQTRSPSAAEMPSCPLPGASVGVQGADKGGDRGNEDAVLRDSLPPPPPRAAS